MTRSRVRATMLALSVLSVAGSATAGRVTIKLQGLDAVNDGGFYDDGVLQLSSPVDDGASLTGFDASSQGTVSEPATLLLLGLGCLGLARYVRRG